MTTQPVPLNPPPTDAPDPAILDLAPRVEAVLLSADRPVQPLRLAEAVGLVQAPEPGEAEAAEGTAARVASAERDAALTLLAAAIEHLNREYAATGRSFRVERLAGGWRVMTLPAFAPVVTAFHRARLHTRLSRQAVETLAIIAYKQPITRAHLEAIRGVSCGEVLRSLVERRVVTVVGRAEELGRPLLYGTTRQFLDQFGLASLNDLPTIAELKPIGV
jgi:segregation and condensation protein B